MVILVPGPILHVCDFVYVLVNRWVIPIIAKMKG